MTIKKQLTGGFSILVAMLVIAVLFASWRMEGVSNVVTTMVNDVMAKERLFSEWAANTYNNGARTITVAESTDVAKQAEIQAKIKETSARISEIQKQLDQFEKNDTEKAMFDEVANNRKIYIAARDEVFNEKKTSEENARKLVQAKLEPALDNYVASIKKLNAYQTTLIDQMADNTKKQNSESKTALIILGAVSVLFGIVIAGFIMRNIKRQLGGEPAYAVQIASKIAEGDLTLSIDTDPNDHSSLLSAMKKMQTGLVKLVSEVRTGTDTIATASSEIATGNLDLSSRTE
ncbi:MCP four helix bundle domain-containing protein, partial [Oxalobacteraceae bacterium R-40]|nr:MCP four helix bundle domain-containing protein [Oxalobacteraceae bacterium R-40]